MTNKGKQSLEIRCPLSPDKHLKPKTKNQNSNVLKQNECLNFAATWWVAGAVLNEIKGNGLGVIQLALVCVFPTKRK